MVVDSSRPVAQVAREIGVHEITLRNWVKAYQAKHPEEEPPLELSERARLRELERENRELKMNRGYSRRSNNYSDVRVAGRLPIRVL
jgi:transposase